MAAQPLSFSEPGSDDEVELDPAAEGGDVDLEWYFDVKKIPVPQRVAICRSYASYLVALGKSGRERKGPPIGTRVKRQRDEQ